MVFKSNHWIMGDMLGSILDTNKAPINNGLLSKYEF